MNVTMSKLILLLFFLLGYCYGQVTNPPASPCPAVFQYVWVSREYQGQITIIPPLKFSQIKLQVKMTVTYFPLVAGVGRIDFKRGVQEIQEISDRVSRKERQQITFIVVFPPGQPTPRIAQVVVNGKELCPNQLKSPDTRGEINLSYILNTGLPYSTHDLDNFLPAGQEDSFINGGVQDNVGNHGFLQIPTSNHHVQKPNQQFPSFVQPVPETPQSLPAFVQPVPETPQSLPAFVQPDPEPIQPWPVHVQTIPELTQPILSQPESVKPVPGIAQSLPYWTIPDHTPTALPKINEPQQTSSSVFKEAPTRTSQAYMHKTRLPEVQDQTEISQYDDTSAENLKCGVRADDYEANQVMVRGFDAEKGEWPWQAALYKTFGTGIQFRCGGSLVTRLHVITAAHCVYLKSSKSTLNAKDIIIFLGKYDLQRLYVETGEQPKEVQAISVHPDYGRANLDFDVAIITFSTPCDVTITVSPVCLWDLSPDLAGIVGKRGVVLGWGRDEKGQVGHILQRADMPVVSQQTCIESDPFFQKYTSYNSYCAGFRNGTTVCNGDSGGGMFFRLFNTRQNGYSWYVRGVTSRAKHLDENGDCDDSSFAIFTDLAKFMPWLTRELGEYAALYITKPSVKLSGESLHTSVQHGHDKQADNNVECGKVAIDPGLPLILGGEKSYPGQWPWHVALYKSDDNVGDVQNYTCGGTLISPTLVLTAASCVTERSGEPLKPDTLLVYLGKYNLRSFIDSRTQEQSVSEVIVHPDFNSLKLTADLALLVLSSPTTNTQYVYPACLWDTSMVNINDIIGQEGTVAGWGFDDSYRLADVLMTAKMPVVSQDVCIHSYPEHFSQFISNRTFCAGYRNGTSVCNGDSGGGMLFATKQPNNSNKWYLRGVVSNSVVKKRQVGKTVTSVCDPNQYIVFTDVAQYLPWIRNYVDTI